MRCVVRMLPVFFTTILYWTIYAQVMPMAVRLLHAPPTCVGISSHPIPLSLDSQSAKLW